MRIMSLLLVCILLVACKTQALLPQTKVYSKSAWDSFESAKNAFDLVVPYKTTVPDLFALGFNPQASPNVEIINFLDIARQFGEGGFKRDELPWGIQQCYMARERCAGYRIKVSKLDSNRVGNVPADLFNFAKKTDISGWEFNATLVLINGTVVYKLWNANPNIARVEKKSNPLGPLQSLEGTISVPGF